MVLKVQLLVVLTCVALPSFGQSYTKRVLGAKTSAEHEMIVCDAINSASLAVHEKIYLKALKAKPNDPLLEYGLGLVYLYERRFEIKASQIGVSDMNPDPNPTEKVLRQSMLHDPNHAYAIATLWRKIARFGADGEGPTEFRSAGTTTVIDPKTKKVLMKIPHEELHHAASRQLKLDALLAQALALEPKRSLVLYINGVSKFGTSEATTLLKLCVDRNDAPSLLFDAPYWLVLSAQGSGDARSADYGKARLRELLTTPGNAGMKKLFIHEHEAVLKQWHLKD